VEEQKKHFQYSCYMEVIMLAAWSVSIHHNNFIFNNEQVSLVQ
jgi:hypothetical protein